MLSINPSETVWTILCFLALLFLLDRFLYRPLVRFMDARKARIDAGLNEEAAAKAALEEDARALEKERERLLQAADEQARAEKRRNEERRVEALREAKQAAADAVKQGRTETVALYAEVDEELKQRRSELGESLARRLLDAGNTEQK